MEITTSFQLSVSCLSLWHPSTHRRRIRRSFYLLHWYNDDKFPVSCFHLALKTVYRWNPCFRIDHEDLLVKKIIMIILSIITYMQSMGVSYHIAKNWLWQLLSATANTAATMPLRCQNIPTYTCGKRIIATFRFKDISTVLNSIELNGLR